ncbi:hypothetical protein BT96DRAFT_92548 [Gymnopus androsaceus JB14]|uniref:Uncharacterized protein n=1 Tax=Gymnopus androsaceus JB14 TaxID=1447944 RepID=A0A6A4HGX1_9AGAR|nr:hypothetical protein BT96DRAFT_92548 [Gymnopus androsaceus JB14]
MQSAPPSSSTTPKASQADSPLTSIPGPSTSGKLSTLNASASGRPLTGPALARKKRLEDDPLTSDLQTNSVLCLTCGQRVKLSDQTHYDTSHWYTHRQRCLKRAGQKDPAPSYSQRPKVAARAKPNKARPKPSRKPKRVTPPSSVSSLTSFGTPSLTSDNEEEIDVSGPEEIKSSSRPPSHPATALVNTSDLLTEQYFVRAHGLHIHLPPVPRDAPTNWRDWRWSDLHVAEFTGTGAYALAQNEPSTLIEKRGDDSVMYKAGEALPNWCDQDSARRGPYPDH